MTPTQGQAPGPTPTPASAPGAAPGRSSVLIDGIGLLYTGDPEREEIADAAMVVQDGRVVWTGPASRAPDTDLREDVGGRCVIPGFVDSHAHLVFAGDRTAEFAARMSGRAYSAGGIRTTVAATRAADDETLRARVAGLVEEMRRQGTTTVEIKSGYGLTVEDELRSLRIAADWTSETTYLGAHVVPDGVSADDYVRLVTGEMLAACAPYARWVDVFCERGAFDGDQSREILTQGMRAGLLPRVHANQLTEGPGVRLAVELGAASADHCTHLSDADVDALASSDTVATLLPGAEFSTRSPYPDARRLIDAGATVAIATDCNPGSSFTSSMPFCVALAVREMRMTPLEAVRAATYGGARALRRDDVGVLRPGARADWAVLDAPSYVHLAYRPGVPLVARVSSLGRSTETLPAA
ncbi:imidazolonepropionase [Nonomuraea longicatena]|uniref:Imidazolonepropionase n=1 Tax=Nonomuraea longicatena TaxID=83682 RepID=A0ABN1RAN9_9ACTN